MLADSVNETARMARATNSLFLCVALYLTLTLLSIPDENLLRNGQVVLPQVGAGISVVQSRTVCLDQPLCARKQSMPLRQR